MFNLQHSKLLRKAMALGLAFSMAIPAPTAVYAAGTTSSEATFVESTIEIVESEEENEEEAVEVEAEDTVATSETEQPESEVDEGSTQETEDPVDNKGSPEIVDEVEEVADDDELFELPSSNGEAVAIDEYADASFLSDDVLVGAGDVNLAISSGTTATIHFAGNSVGNQDKPENLHNVNGQFAYCIDASAHFVAGTGVEVGSTGHPPASTSGAAYTEEQMKQFVLVYYYYHDVVASGLDSKTADWLAQAHIWRMRMVNPVYVNGTVSRTQQDEWYNGFTAWYAANSDKYDYTYTVYRTAGHSASQPVMTFTAKVKTVGFTPRINIQKVDANGNKINASFQYRIRFKTGTQNKWTSWSSTQTSDAQGRSSVTVSVTGQNTVGGVYTDWGQYVAGEKTITYEIQEVTAPKGYQLATSNFSATVNLANCEISSDGKTFTVKGGTNWNGTMTWTNPNTTGVYAIKNNPEVKQETGGITLQKSSANPTLTNGNRMYSLAGATYGIYKSESDANNNRNSVGTLTTTASGSSNTVTGLTAGTYYIKETTAPTGFKLDTTVHRATVTAGENTPITTVRVTDQDINDPIDVLLIKVDAENGSAQGEATLEGAEFTVKYYDVASDTDPAASGEEAVYEWVFETDLDKDGYTVVYFDEDHKILGPEITMDEEAGYAVFPLGTITIQETKAPTGYQLDNTVYVVNTVAGANGSVTTSNLPNTLDTAVQESVIKGGVQIQKIDMSTGKAEPSEGATFAGITYSITSENDATVLVDGQEYAKGEVVATVTTNEGGIAKTATDLLPYGTYTVTETAGNKSYEVNTEWSQTFEIRENGKVVSVDTDGNAIENPDVRKPEISTTATDAQTGDHTGSIFGEMYNRIRALFGDKDVSDNGIEDAKEQTIFDKVTLTHLKNNTTYNISGELMNQGANAPILVNGERVTQSATVVVKDGKITAPNGEPVETINYNAESDTVDGSVTLTFKFDASELTGTTIVVFETLYQDGKEIAVHHDIEDGKQSVHNPEIHTTATDIATGDQVARDNANEPLVIDDAVEVTKIVKGQAYKLFGKLVDVDASTEENVVYLTDEDGNILTASASFVADEEHLEDYREDSVVSDDEDMPSVSGTVHLTYTVDRTNVQGKTIVVFEGLYYQDKLIAVHADLADEKQTVYVPNGKTNATNAVDGMHQAIAGKNVTIKDRVYFENLLEGKEITVDGTLHYQTDFDVNGDGTISDDEAKAGDTLGKMENTVSGNSIAAKTIVRDANGNIIPAEGATQSVTFVPGEDIIDAEGFTNVTVTEKANGQKTYSGYVDLTFTIDATDLAGMSVVAFEEFKHNGVTIFTHADINDLAQTVKIPKISTTATSEGIDETTIYNEDGSYKTVTINDAVKYENLWTAAELEELHKNDIFDINEDVPYIIRGILMDRETGEMLTDNEGNTYVEYSDPFTADDSGNGTQNVVFTIDPSKFEKDGENLLNGKTLVVFETLYRANTAEEINEDAPIAKHEDINDVDQDIRIPNGRTHATDGAAEADADHANDSTDHEVFASEEMTVRDIVSYEGLHADTDYDVTGTLQVVTETDENGKPTKWENAKDDNGKVITNTVRFTTPSSDSDVVSGTVEIVFNFSGVSLAGNTLVAFESVKREGKTVFVHADINDEAQTVYVPAIRTFASDAVTGLNEGLAGGTNYIIDEIRYENLERGKTYTVQGKAVDPESLEARSDVISGAFVAGTENQFVTADGTVIDDIESVRKALADGSAMSGTSLETRVQ